MSAADLLRLPPAPRYDAQKDGNPFAWIVATAPKVREQHQDVMDDNRYARRVAQRLYNKPVTP